MSQRHRLEQILDLRLFEETSRLKGRLLKEAKRLREQSELLQHRDATLRQARQAATGSHISEWVRSPGLQPPE